MGGTAIAGWLMEIPMKLGAFGGTILGNLQMVVSAMFKNYGLMIYVDTWCSQALVDDWRYKNLSFKEWGWS